MEAVQTSPPSIPHPTQSSFDSLDHAMQQVDDILKMDFSSTEAQQDPEAITDPESQYKADSTHQEDSKQPASPSPGRTPDT